MRMSQDTNAPYRVLSRKYRPQTLSDLKGQEILSTALRKAIEENKIPHAFLFHGIRGVGKTTTARILAKALNCIGTDGKGSITCEPCGKCSSCLAILEERHLDVIEMDAASHTSVDDIREIIEACRYKAVQGRFKIFIIDEVHMLSKSAFNALLKTLEEPPVHVKFIFATTELKKIPDTILSRCQRFDLKRMDQTLLISYLGEIAKKEGFESDLISLSILARAADGSMRDGLSLLDQAITLTLGNNKKEIEAETVRNMLGQSDRGRLIDLIESLLRGQVEEGLSHTRILLESGSDPLLLLQDILDFIYAMTTIKTQNIKPDLGLSDREMSKVIDLCSQINVSIFLQSWQILIKGYEELSKSPLQNETLEMVLIRLCYVLPISTLDFSQKAQHVDSKPTIIPLSEESTINSFQKLLSILESKKEVMMASHLRHDVHLVSFEQGKIVVRLKDNVKPSFIQTLKDFLDQYTLSPWIIDTVSTGGEKTIVEKQQEKLKNLEDEAKAQPIVREILDSFPESQVTISTST
jgi:DNA polymerase-3 subunit gamma/tau